MDQKLKERLVGAIVLVVLVVLVVPSLLTGPRSPPKDPVDETQIRTTTIILSQPQGSVVPEAAAAPDSAAEPPAVADPSFKPAGDPETVAAAPVTQMAPKLAAPKGGTVLPQPSLAVSATPPSVGPAVAAGKPTGSVSSGAESQPGGPSNAKGAQPPTDKPAPVPVPALLAPHAAQSEAAAKMAHPQPAPGPALAARGNPTPVPSAPVVVAQAAVQAKRPTPLPKAEPNPLPKPSSKSSPLDATGGWVVQLGSFSSKENAEKLVHELKAKKFKAFVSQYRGNGKILWRVRVGPEQDHSRIQRIAERLAADGHNGTVAPAQ